MDRLKSEALGLLDALGDSAVSSLRNKVEGATGRLTDYVEGDAGPGLMAAVTGAKGLAEGKSPARALLGAGGTALKEKVGKLSGKGGREKKKLKLTNIIESIDVGVPISLAYNQWTQFTEFPSFMKKVENVEQAEDQKLNWKAQVFWSHRTWEGTILEQVPDDKIIWRSKGAKGHVDGAVTFHELAPSLTRILVVLEYHPQGMFEHTGNIWRAQGRRVRLELKHFRRHLMSEVLLHPEDVEGWRGVIEDGEVVQDHESALAEEQGQGEREHGQDAIDDEGQQADSEAGSEYLDDQYENGAEGEPEVEDEQIDRDQANGKGRASHAAGAPEDRPRRTLHRVGTRGGESS
jgi:uncharacterized membrane protein